MAAQGQPLEEAPGPALPWGRAERASPAKRQRTSAGAASASAEPLSLDAVGLALGDTLEVAWVYEEEAEEAEVAEGGEGEKTTASLLRWCRAILEALPSAEAGERTYLVRSSASSVTPPKPDVAARLSSPKGEVDARLAASCGR